MINTYLVVSSKSSWYELSLLVVIFIIVLIGAYLTSRWLSQVQYNQNKCKNMMIIESLRVSPNNVVQIIKTGDKYLVIGVTKDRISVITELEEENIVNNSEKNSQINLKGQFNQILNKAMKK